MSVPKGRRQVDPQSGFHPRYVVWELTLKCDLACRHCGSRAGQVRADELTLPQALDVLDQLVDAGTQEITFIGGEAYLNPDWLEIVRVASARGIHCGMTTGARALDAEMARAGASAGLRTISVSIDGLESTHDTLRAVQGSYRAAIAALGHIRDAGIRPFANTQFNQLNLGEVEELAETLFSCGVVGWQVQLTGPMGRAADRDEWLLQPYQMLDLIPRLGRIAKAASERGVLVAAGNNLGYFGPWERWIRIDPFQGCAAGRHVLGIESNGDTKGCPSLPSAPYVKGNVGTEPLAEVWERLTFARDRTTEELWGHCKGCYYAEVCRGGCAWTSHTLLGKRGNMPYCHHRAETLEKQGIRERIEKVEAAPGEPFDFGRYRLVEEAVP
ncbi:MAG: radical SAM protein [Proteobacteria bacterium]|nr:radical SAM protein [Pseudomonadota bacterium]MCP4915882.1 radical SAM protein [Pseudomonadota bacterium]